MLYNVEVRQMTLFIIGLVQLAYFFSASFVKVKQVTPTGLPLSSLAAAGGGGSGRTYTYIHSTTVGLEVKCCDSFRKLLKQLSPSVCNARNHGFQRNEIS